MTDDNASTPPEWIQQILARWDPPEDYDARLAAVVDGYLAATVRPISSPSASAAERA